MKRVVKALAAALTAFADLTAVASATQMWGYQPRLPKSLRKG